MTRPVPHDVIAYAPELHRGFVQSSWGRGSRQPWEALATHLRRPGARLLVAHVAGDPDSLLGWVLVVDGALVWWYVRRLFDRIRGRGLGTSLLLAAGLDPARPTPCLNWNHVAAEIAARGYRLYPAPQVPRKAA